MPPGAGPRSSSNDLRTSVIGRSPPPRPEVAAYRTWKEEKEAAWSAVEHACFWPPNADTWRGLDAECLAAWSVLLTTGTLGSYSIAGARPNADYDELLPEALKNPLGIRRAVDAALDRPECRVPKGEGPFPDLRETCAADDMERLAVLQGWCRPLLADEKRHLRDREEAKSRVHRQSLSQEEFYSEMKLRDRLDAALLWGLSTCRSLPHEVLPLFDHLPEENQHRELNLLAFRLGVPKPKTTMIEEKGELVVEVYLRRLEEHL